MVSECAKPSAPDAISLFKIKNFWHFDTRNNFSGSGQGSRETEVFKKTLIGFPHLSSLVGFAH